MKRDRAMLVAGLTGLMAVFFAMNVFAEMPMGNEGQGKGPHKGMGKQFSGMFEELGLSDEQKEALKKNREQHGKEFGDLREKMRAKRQELGAELQKAEFDMEKVKSIHGELKAVMMTMEDQQLAAILEIRKVLTAEQFARFEAKALEMRKGRGRPHGDKGGKGMTEK